MHDDVLDQRFMKHFPYCRHQRAPIAPFVDLEKKAVIDLEQAERSVLR